MENKNSTNEEQEITLEQLADVTGGAETFVTLPDRVFVTRRRVPELPISIGSLRDPGTVFIPARPRLMDSLPADLISLVEKL